MRDLWGLFKKVAGKRIEKPSLPDILICLVVGVLVGLVIWFWGSSWLWKSEAISYAERCGSLEAELDLMRGETSISQLESLHETAEFLGVTLPADDIEMHYVKGYRETIRELTIDRSDSQQAETK